MIAKESGGIPVNAVLIRNWLTLPVGDESAFSGSRGPAGEAIKLLASDDIEVVAVRVQFGPPTSAFRDAEAAN